MLLALSTDASTQLVVPQTPPQSKVLRRPVESAQFTAGAFTEAVLSRGIRLSMDGKGCWRDNVFVERVFARDGQRRSKFSMFWAKVDIQARQQST
ncbi:hypothetical protein [Paraburkholderia sp. RL17-373-BIF-A]|uniref:hypothetical protein n=1 Tax=Paraburkholderia sp. RL17-373-BIF-A TaxID=3031629 RepID=UPI0038B95667